MSSRDEVRLNRVIAIAEVARSGLAEAVRLASLIPPPPGPDPLGDDLIPRLAGCVETLDGEIAHYRALAIDDPPPGRPALRVVSALPVRPRGGAA